jgi:hypothetical protein
MKLKFKLMKSETPVIDEWLEGHEGHLQLKAAIETAEPDDLQHGSHQRASNR